MDPPSAKFLNFSLVYYNSVDSNIHGVADVKKGIFWEKEIQGHLLDISNDYKYLLIGDSEMLSENRFMLKVKIVDAISGNISVSKSFDVHLRYPDVIMTQRDEKLYIVIYSKYDGILGISEIGYN